MPVIAVASANPVKIKAARRGFERMFPDQQFTIQSVIAPSGVSHQPLTSMETLAGARNRIANAFALYPTADYWIGIEGGVEEEDGMMTAFAWVAVRTADRIGQARSGAFALPPAVADLVREGKELGEADDIIFGRINSKQANGAIGLLTEDALDRAALYEQAVILALVSFKNPELYP